MTVLERRRCYLGDFVGLSWQIGETRGNAQSKISLDNMISIACRMLWTLFDFCTLPLQLSCWNGKVSMNDTDSLVTAYSQQRDFSTDQSIKLTVDIISDLISDRKQSKTIMKLSRKYLFLCSICIFIYFPRLGLFPRCSKSQLFTAI